jgi:hypothetical protein
MDDMDPGHATTADAARTPRWRRRRPFTRRDWLGDCLITIAAGLVITAGVFLPWANADTGRQVNLSPTKPDTILPALATGWGVWVLVLGLTVLVAGALLLALGPRRLAVVCGPVIAVAGVVVVLTCQRAAAPMAGFFRPGLGIYIDVLAGVLLVPIGFAVAVVGYLLANQARRATD